MYGLHPRKAFAISLLLLHTLFLLLLFQGNVDESMFLSAPFHKSIVSIKTVTSSVNTCRLECVNWRFDWLVCSFSSFRVKFCVLIIVPFVTLIVNKRYAFILCVRAAVAQDFLINGFGKTLVKYKVGENGHASDDRIVRASQISRKC